MIYNQPQIYMKNTLLILSLIFMVAISVHAQSLSGGVKAGLNVANQNISYGSISFDSKSKIGIHVGGYVTLMFTEKLGLQPELLYSTQGCKLEFAEDYKYNLSYLNLPVLVRYNITEMISAHAGPQFGFLTSAKYEVDGASVDSKEDFKGIDFSLVFGAGVELPLGLNAGMRYCLGLSNISEDEDESGTIKNSNFQIYVGYRLFGQ